MSMIGANEIGDKTFFIAVLLALRQSRGPVFLGTFGALASMSIVSVALGMTLYCPLNTFLKRFAYDSRQQPRVRKPG